VHAFSLVNDHKKDEKQCFKSQPICNLEFTRSPRFPEIGVLHDLFFLKKKKHLMSVGLVCGLEEVGEGGGVDIPVKS
jgi:hypothetical protein